ncbi:MAG: AbrB/MazE/SpoVT family DNA-binding domain-containing protein [Clostridia bacterium]|nr:AbrB/MazE/SpoVT family DNA-binding domain-containing protein [Clostridia bacterium]
MKATGIVRRIDDLGRVVIPKEIRRTMRIREGDPLEIYTDREGEVIFKKYSPIGELNEFAAQYAEILHKTCNMSVLITDRDSVIACAGVPRREYGDKRLSADLEKIIENRALYTYRPGERKLPVIDDAVGAHYAYCVMPIIAEGDIIGCVASVLSEGDDASRRNTESDTKLIRTAAGFLGKQLES